ncbi:MAG: DUF1588 domain-containing protein [Myxococcaceae bacterium]|nr:DUF1588 domain-containing protein [Myxococcaceae bacterium]
MAPAIGVRRLSRVELDNTLRQLVQDPNHLALTLFPGDPAAPFDNATDNQTASAIWLEAAERVAEQVSTAAMASTSIRASLVPCVPTGSADIACLEAFARSFGRQALRRPLSDAEVTEFTNLHALAIEHGDFWTSAAVVMRRLLLDPEFLFRVEPGTVTTQEGVIQLSAFELASRMSFLIQGRAPEAWLLDEAAAGKLDTVDGIRAAATKLLQAPQGQERIELFHAMWLGYWSLPHDADFNASLVRETQALVHKIVFTDRADYRGLFLFDQTYIDSTLATHYGLPPPPEGTLQWVPYGSSGRKGVLSHGSLLSNGVKQTDTSPTLRGKWIRNRLFCQEIPPPPPNVTADVPPPTTSAACKTDRYAIHDNVASCAKCHKQMDPVGFGLEQFDRTGKFRDHEAAQPQCAITGKGKLEGIGDFTGPSQLADLMTTSGQLDSCVVRQLFRYGSGRRELNEDEALIAQLTQSFVNSDRRFDELILAIVSHPAFAQRRDLP